MGRVVQGCESVAALNLPRPTSCRSKYATSPAHLFIHCPKHSVSHAVGMAARREMCEQRCGHHGVTKTRRLSSRLLLSSRGARLHMGRRAGRGEARGACWGVGGARVSRSLARVTRATSVVGTSCCDSPTCHPRCLQSRLSSSCSCRPFENQHSVSVHVDCRVSTGPCAPCPGCGPCVHWTIVCHGLSSAYRGVGMGQPRTRNASHAWTARVTGGVTEMA